MLAFFAGGYGQHCPQHCPQRREERWGSIWIIVASPFEQAPNHDPQTIRKNAPQTPENREHESVRNEFAG